MLNVSHNLANELSSAPLDMPSLLDFMPAPQQDSKQFSHFWSNFSMADVGFFLLTKALYTVELSHCRLIAHKLLFFCTTTGTTARRPLGIVQNTVKHPVTLRYVTKSVVQSPGKEFVTSLPCPSCALTRVAHWSNSTTAKKHGRVCIGTRNRYQISSETSTLFYN